MTLDGVILKGTKVRCSHCKELLFELRRDLDDWNTVTDDHVTGGQQFGAGDPFLCKKCGEPFNLDFVLFSSV